MNKKKEGAMVCLSGGQDSTTCLFWAKENYEHVESVTFDYGQVHEREKEAVVQVSEIAGVKLNILTVPALHDIAGGGLTSDEIDVLKPHPVFPDLPGSFVPLRNLILLSIAAAAALKKGMRTLITGVCQTDYSGYPDCRRNFIDSLETTIMRGIASGTDPGFKIETPLMHLTKAETVDMAQELPGCFEALAYTHTCYQNAFPPCGECAACELRAKGFADAECYDPLVVRGGME